MLANLIKVLTFSSTASPLIPCIIGWSRYGQLSKVQRILVYLVTSSFITDALGLALRSYDIPNLAIYNAYALVNFNLIWFIYQAELPALRNKAIRLTQLGINIFAVVNTLFIQSITIFNSNLLVICSISFLILSTFSFFNLLQEVKYTRLEKNPIFWINSGVIVYYSGTLILFLLSNRIANDAPNAYDLHLASWGLNSVFNVLLITSYSFALWVRPTK